MEDLSKEWEEKAEHFADSRYPNPSKYDAPFTTTVDLWNENVDAYLEGAKAMRESILKELDNTHPDWEDPYNHKECFERATLLKIFDNIKPVE